jgi:sugar phosphate isomerase/epimerase
MDDVDEYLRKNLAFHRELGFASVNFGYRVIDAMGENMPTHIERALQSSAETGVRYGVAHLPFVSQTVGLPDDDSFVKRMRRCIDAYKMAGVEYAVVHPNSTTLPLTEYDPVKEYDNVMGHLAPFVEYGNRVGLSIVIENMRVVHGDCPVHRFGAGPEELCKVADELGIGICWDTGHAHITGLTQSEAITYVGDRLKMLHLNDNFAGDDVHLVPFVGTVDWQDVAFGMRCSDFSGILDVEVTAWALPGDEQIRTDFGGRALSAAKKLIYMAEQ